MKYSAADIGNVMGIDFTDDQREAIEQELEPGVIIAGAGAGKTAVMAARVVYLVANRLVEPEQVLGLTYTNLATGELASRVRRDLGALADAEGIGLHESEEPTIKTYHSFASELVSEYGLRIGLEPDLLNIADARRAQLCAELLRSIPMDDVTLSTGLTDTIKKILKLDDELSNCAVSVADATAFDLDLIERIEASPTSVGELRAAGESAKARVELLRLVAEFRRLKRDRDFIDYADMPRYALELVSAMPELAAAMRERFRVVLLDEYQDTSIAQRELMKRLFGGGHPVTAVGDPMQCIFAFNGSSPSNMTRFSTDFPNRDGKPARRHDLSLTQRNGQNIVDLANLLTPNLRAVSGSRPLEPAPNPKFGPGRVQLASFKTSEAEAEWVLKTFEELASSEGIPLEEIVVLLRTNAQVSWFYAKCIELGIPAQIRGKRALLEVPELAELVSTLRVVAEPAANAHWARILTNPRWRIGKRDLAEVGRIARGLARRIDSNARDLDSVLARAVESTDSVDLVAYGDAVEEIAAGRKGERLSAAARERLTELQREVAYLRAHMGEPLGDFVFRVARTSGLLAEASASNDRVRRGMHVNLRSMLSMVADFTALDGEKSLFAFLDWLDDAQRFNSATRIEGPVHKGALQLMTAHSAKGLQFRAVALPRLAEGVFPEGKGRDKWLTNSGVLPMPLRDEEMSDFLRRFPDTTAHIKGQEFKDWGAAVDELDELDERRLGYVSITRSRDVLLLSTSHAHAGDSKQKPPSAFWQELHDGLLELNPAAVGPVAEFSADDVELPPTVGQWPAQLESAELQATRVLAELVEATRGEAVPPAESPALAGFDAAIDALVAEFTEREQRQRLVPLPEALSVSQLMLLNRDPEAFTSELLRPMPKAPALAADRGTAFHSWVEERAKQLAGPGIQLALPYEDETSGEDGEALLPTPLDPALLQRCQANFLASEWAERTPAFVEFPFALGVGSRVLRGRVDAVFAGSEGWRWSVVDWKTNTAPTADPLQLSVYRLAVARALDCDPREVRAGFYYAALDRTVWLEEPLDLGGIELVLAGD